MVLLRRVFSLTVVLVAMSILAVHAETTSQFKPELLHKLELSDDLFSYGIANENVEAMAIAAEIRANALGVWVIEADAVGGILSPDEMLNEASKRAIGDSLALALIQRIKERRFRGAVDGPFVEHYTIDHNDTYTKTVRFRANQPAIVYVASPVEIGVSLEVRNADGEQVCLKNGSKSRQVCIWHPVNEGDYLIKAYALRDAKVEIEIVIN